MAAAGVARAAAVAGRGAARKSLPDRWVPDGPGDVAARVAGGSVGGSASGAGFR
jgi:hypothetical protein